MAATDPRTARQIQVAGIEPVVANRRLGVAWMKKVLVYLTYVCAALVLISCDLLTGTPTAPPARPASQLRITVSQVPSDLPDYDRGDWRHWVDSDGDCQDARQEVLVAESLTPVTFKTRERCRVRSGSWVGPYTGTPVDDPSRLDVDHMVPLANAHRSGGWRWNKDRKALFANDLGYEGHLIATTAAANRAKGSKGPEDWRPADRGYWCDYALDWTTIKNRWGLTATPRELEGLREMADTCEPPYEITAAN